MWLLKQYNGARLLLKRQSPHQACKSACALQITEDMPRLMKVVGAETNVGIGSQRYNMKRLATQIAQMQMQLQSRVIGIAVGWTRLLSSTHLNSQTFFHSSAHRLRTDFE